MRPRCSAGIAAVTGLREARGGGGYGGATTTGSGRPELSSSTASSSSRRKRNTTTEASRKAPYIYVAAFLCVTLGIMMPLAQGETIHMTRDFGYSSREQLVQSTRRSPPVVTDEDAARFLKHYGYLRCNASDAEEKTARMRRAVPTLDLQEGVDVTNEILPGCSRLDLTHAVVMYQDILHLPITGVIDAVTRERMNRARCGDQDSHLVELEEAKLSSGAVIGSKEDTTSLLNTQHGGRVRRHVETSSDDSNIDIDTHSHKGKHIDYTYNDHSPNVEPQNSHNTAFLSQNNETTLTKLYDIEVNPSSHTHHKFIPEPKLEIYIDEHGSVFGREPGQVHPCHHHPIPEGEVHEHHSPLSKLLTPNRLLSRRRQQYDKIKHEILTSLRTAAAVNESFVNETRTFNNNDTSYDDFGVYNQNTESNLRKVRGGDYNTSAKRKHHQTRVKRSEPSSTAPLQSAFDKRMLTYKIEEGAFSQRIPLIEQCTAVSLAFRMWAEVTNIDFRPASSGTSVDITLAFAKGDHLNCNRPFYGQGGEVAHTIRHGGKGQVHFDDDERWVKPGEGQSDSVPFLMAAIHEIGHVLGLSHLQESYSIMYPNILDIETRLSSTELTTLDRKAIQDLYGQCTGSFDGAFDWLHTKPYRYTGLNCMRPCECEEQLWQYFTYFFREDSYWLYLNQRNRPRYGDPLLIKQEWKGLPPRVDGMTQIMTKHTGVCVGKKQVTQFEFRTLFFKGDTVYTYDDVRDVVTHSNKISDMFPPKDGQTESIPNNIDAVIFDPRNNHLFFFKGEWVWEVDPFSENTTCCIDKHEFSALYPSLELTGSVDAGYLRWGEKQVYFYHGEYVYVAKLHETVTLNGNVIQKWQSEINPAPLSKIGKWNGRWNDICDVVTATYTMCPDL